MAYTLNNTQPVICTLVSDQPYFYMEECGDGDDALPDDNAVFERDLIEIERKLHALETMGALHERDPERRIEAVIAEAVNIFIDDTPESATLDVLMNNLAKSRTASAMIDFAITNGVSIKPSMQVFAANYDRDAQTIFVNPHLALEEQHILCARELRRHWHHKKGIAFSAQSFHPDHAVLINRAIEADLAATMARVVWELQLGGRKDIWTYFEGTSFAPVARSYAREAFIDFRSIANGKAASAAFESWFLSDHCHLADKKLIQAMLSGSQGYIFDDEDGSRAVAKKILTILGEQPWGNNYLSTHTDLMFEDPLFIEVRDRSNANFLWFIKFERSFLKTEDALQNASDKVGCDLPQGPPHPFLENVHSSDQSKIISLAERGILPSPRRKLLSGETSASRAGNVICLPTGNNFGR